jgi:hypothetical protein
MDDAMTKMEIIIQGNIESINVDHDNIDVFVFLEGDVRYSATFYTIKNIVKIIYYYKTTHECSDGLYFLATNMIILKDLSSEMITETIKSLMASGGFYSAFAGPFLDS